MLRMDRKAALHIAEMVLLADDKHFSVDIQKKVTGFCFIPFGCCQTRQKHLWVGEIMVENVIVTTNARNLPSAQIFSWIIMDFYHIL